MGDRRACRRLGCLSIMVRVNRAPLIHSARSPEARDYAVPAQVRERRGVPGERERERDEDKNQLSGKFSLRLPFSCLLSLVIKETCEDSPEREEI